jgi:DNA repair exonuclease SbcCD ATPase subunit
MPRRQLMDFDANNPSTRLLSDLDLKALGEEVASEDRRRDADIASLQTKLADAREEAAALKEGAVRAADAHSKALAAAQRRVAALSEEHQTLQRVHRQCDPLSHELRAEHAQAMAQLKDLQRDLKESIGSGGGKGNVESLQREVSALRDENQKLRGELQDGTSARRTHMLQFPVCLNVCH